MTLAPPRFENHRAMLLAGLRADHRLATLELTIPAQWQRFRAIGDVPGRVGRITYGAMCGTDAAKQQLEYMCAVEVSSFDALPETAGRMRVPAAHYAVFTHEGDVTALPATWKSIWEDWAPASGWTPAPTPDFERYGEGFDMKTRSGDIEIWIPILRAEA